MSKHYFIKGKPDAHNPHYTMLFKSITVRDTITVCWTAARNITEAVAFQSEMQAIKYLYSYIKPFVKSEDFKGIEIIEIDTTYIDEVNECFLNAE